MITEILALMSLTQEKSIGAELHNGFLMVVAAVWLLGLSEADMLLEG